MRQYKAKIKSVEQAAANVSCFELELIDPGDINFRAGQYILVKIPLKTPIFRAYSIYSSPGQKNIIKLCVTLVAGGKASEFFKTLKGGEELEFRGPLGHFTLKAAPEYFFIATGSGIAPLRSMIYHLLKENPRTKITLYFGLRREENIFLQNELKRLERKYPHFRYTLTLSRPSEKWPGAKGRVTEHLKNLPNYQNKKYYLCGSTAMINEVLDILQKRGVSYEDILFERFY